MNRVFLLICMVMMVGITVAQEMDELPFETDRIRAQRGAYITNRLDLNSEQTAHFWTVFNEYESRKRDIEIQLRTTGPLPTTDEEADAYAMRRFELEAELLQLKRLLYEELKKGIPARKVILLPQAEREFKRELLRQLRQRRQSGNRRSGGGRG